MNDFKLTQSRIGELVTQLTKLDTGKTYRVSVKEWRESRSLSQNGLQHMIYGDISKYLIKNGRGEWTPEYVKMNLKSKFLGWEVARVVDVVTGEIAEKEVLRSTKDLDTGEAYHYTTQIIDWADSINCPIRVPQDCEYNKLTERQEQ